MAKLENDEKPKWSTWEELLLACAVHRYGIDSWDSVAVEIQKHNSTFRTLTAFDCRHKYYDLKRRFSPGSGEDETVSEISSVPWLEELRKLRVDELRREVERYDLSISSLQMKVKRLEDERENSLKMADTEIVNSDLAKTVEMKESHRESNNNSNAIEPRYSPDLKENSHGDESENTNRDVKIIELVNKEPIRIDEADTDEKTAREDSCKGSCEETAANSDRAKPGREGNDSPEFVELMDESKGEEEEAKETSDVQSSASLSRKETQEQNEPDQSVTVDRKPVESRPLINFIEILQSHPIGSHFSRRLEIQLQETPEYNNIIKQHIDFDMIRTRVEEDYYKTSRSKFFRDLLLLINNARVFYGERSSEFNAANQLNQLIMKQMSLKIPKQITKEESLVTTSKEEEVTTVSSLKPKMAVPIIACRKRSSLAVRSPPATKIVSTISEKPVSKEEEDEISDKDEKPIVSKKNTKGRTHSTSKKVKTSLNVGLTSKGQFSKESSEQKKSDQEKKGNNITSGSSKKKSAASFLKRMKGVSSSETVKSDSSNGKRGAEQRRSNTNNDKVNASSGQKRAISKKPTIEKGSPAKKNTEPATKRVSKRSNEANEKETDSSSRPKKRSRRL